MDSDRITYLIKRAENARGNAYAPYSGFKVGAALLASDGRVFTGCNAENASFGAGICAERAALFSAVSNGCRSFDAIAVTAGGETVCPCGICRQALCEFSPEILVICAASDKYETYRLSELLPHSFDKFSPEVK